MGLKLGFCYPELGNKVLCLEKLKNKLWLLGVGRLMEFKEIE